MLKMGHLGRESGEEMEESKCSSTVGKKLGTCNSVHLCPCGMCTNNSATGLPDEII